MLPLHLALFNDNIDEVIVNNLIKENPTGLLCKDRLGRTPLVLKGKATVSCFNAALALEKAWISKREEEAFQLKLSSEKQMHEKKVKEIKEEANALFRDLTGNEIEVLEKCDEVSAKETQILEMKLAAIDLASQNESAVHNLELHQISSKDDAQEIAWLNALITKQNREISGLNQKVKQQKTKISDLKVSRKAGKASLTTQKEISTDLQMHVDTLNKNITHLQQTICLQYKISSHVDTMKRQQQVCDLLTSQIRNLEMELKKSRNRENHPGDPGHQVDSNWTKNFSTIFNNITNVV